MIFENLKKSIIQAAVLGRLTEPLPEDDEVQDLYKQICKQNIFSKFDIDEINFNIPNHWIWVRLGNIADIRGGKRIPVGEKLTRTDTGFKYVRVADMHNGTILNKDIHYVSKEIHNSIKNYTISSNDLYITVAGSIGRIGTIPDEFDGANLTENADKLVFKLINKYWLNYALQSTFVQQQISEMTTKVGQPKLAIKRIQSLILPLPPTKEQDRISSKLEVVLNELENLKNDEIKLDKLLKTFPKKMKESLLLHAVQGKLTKQLTEDGDAYLELKEIIKNNSKHFKNTENHNKDLIDIFEKDIPFDIPDNWYWTKLGNIGYWSSGATPLKSNINYYKNGAIPWLRTGDLNDNIISSATEYITELALKQTSVKMFQKGTILLAMYGATIGKLGILDIESTTNQACCGCIVFNGIHNKYLFYYLMSQRKEFINQGVGGAQPNISKEKIVKNSIPLPPYKEQVRIVKILDEMLPLCDSLI